MKRHCKIIISVITMALFICLIPCNMVAYADPITAAQVASTAYAIMSSTGISFTATDATGSGLNNFLSQQVDEFASSQQSSIAEYFVGRLAVNTAGKLVVGQTLYNSVVNFINWLSDKFGLGDTDSTLKHLDYHGTPIGEVIVGSASWTGEGVGGYFSDYVEQNPPYHSGFHQFNAMNGQQFINSYSSGAALYYNGTYSIVSRNNTLYALVPYYYVHNGAFGANTEALLARNVTLENGLTWNGENYLQPTVINPSQEWVGDIEGYSVPDTNLDQLLGDIDEALADGDLVVDGEIIDVPIPPEPTPIPIDPQTPLSEVPWEGLDNNLQDLYEQGLEENGLIGDLNQSVSSGFSSLFGWLQDIIDWLQSIWEKIENVGLDIIDAIEHFLESFESIGMDIVEWLQSIFEAVSDIVESILSADANWFSDIVDAILTPFRPWINTLKSATGLWHYIVEWLQCIATPFGFFWSILSGIGACFVRPIYAVAAFAIVIAIYKRFGK